MSGDNAAVWTSWSGHCSTAALQGHDLSPADLDNAADTRTMCNVGFSNNDDSGLVNDGRSEYAIQTYIPKSKLFFIQPKAQKVF